MPTELVSVLFRGDFGLAVLQARSIVRYFNHDDIATIRVIVNDTVHPKGLLDAYGPLAPKVRFHEAGRVTRYDLQPFEGPATQQVLKMRAAALVETDTHILLDGKNLFVRPTGLSDFVRDGKLRMLPKPALAKPSPELMGCFQINMDIVGVEGTGWQDMSLPMITPFIIHTATMRDLLVHIEARHGKPFEEVFLRDHHPSSVYEFILYNAYLIKTGRYDDLYWRGEHFVAGLWPSQRERNTSAREWMDVFRDPECKVMALHRKYLKDVEPFERHLIAEFLYRERFIEHRADFDALLDDARWIE